MSDESKKPVELSVQEAAMLACPSRPLIDIRTVTEQQAGIPSGAISLAPEDLLDKLKSNAKMAESGGYLLCAEGIRSRELAERLSELGINSFSSVSGGFKAWVEAGLPTGYPQGLDANQAERYARHLVMPQVGPQGQRLLLESRILLVGLGGLNSPAALYLAAAGVGTLGLVDDEAVERSNLQRQVIHQESGIGKLKTESAANAIAALNPELELQIFNHRIDETNAESRLRGWDVVVDGTDNFPARYALNTACVKLGIPLVYGAVMRFQGQVSVFWPGAPEHDGDEAPPCFQCMVPVAPSAQDAPGCSVAGVLGVLPGIVGTLQANEALKLVLGLGRPLTGRLLMFDALQMDFRQAAVRNRPGCPACGRN